MSNETKSTAKYTLLKQKESSRVILKLDLFSPVALKSKSSFQGPGLAKGEADFRPLGVGHLEFFFKSTLSASFPL